MKSHVVSLFAATLALACAIALSPASPAQGAVTLEVLNPRGEIMLPPTLAPAPRVADLAGKKIGIYWNHKAGGNLFLDVIEKLLKEKYPTAVLSRYEGPFDLGEAMAAKVSREADAFIYGVGD